MTQQHPITPPPTELVLQWIGEFFGCTAGGELSDSERFLTTRAAQWGADQELEACCEWMADETPTNYINALRAARRSKSPSLKEQALDDLHIAFDRGCLSERQADTIRHALEQLPDHE
jgi:hypothetical protein